MNTVQRRSLFIIVWLSLSPCARPQTTTSTVFYRQRSGGSIFSIDGRDGTQMEIEGSSNYARFVGLALHRRKDRIVWSDGRSVKSASAVDGSDVKFLIGALARIVWVGANFGHTQEDIEALTVKGIQCESILSWTSERVECMVGLPQYYTKALLSETDCSIRTKYGIMSGIAADFTEIIASGTLAPVVQHIDIFADFVLPHALAIDDREGEEWLYWSNSKDGTIYRSSLQSTIIQVLQRRCWSVRGLTLHIFQDTKSDRVSLLYSLESKGTISYIELPPTNKVIKSPPAARVLLRGLHSPRGLAIDTAKQILFFTEKTGRIFQTNFGTCLTTSDAYLNDCVEENSMLRARQIIARTSRTRLDGIAVDSKYLYWCESNTNVVVRALRRDYQPQTIIGGTANSKLSWPRSIVLGSEDGETNELTQSYFYSEYTGRVSKGLEQIILVNELNAPAMEYLDDIVKQSTTQRDGNHFYMYALE